MSLLKDVLKEIAATGSTGANAVAGFHGSLFGAKPEKRKKTPVIRRIKFTNENVNRFVGYSKTLSKSGNLYDGGILDLTREKEKGESRLQYLMGIISEDITGATDFDASDVVSKLEAAEKKAKLDRDTITFGLKNDDGDIVQVYVPKDQAEEFEYALSHMLANSDYNSDDENSSMEIAEVLFKLKDRFDIVDVDWGEIPEDEEQEQQTVAGSDESGEGATGGEGENPIDQAAASDKEGGEGMEGDTEGGDMETNAGFSGDEEKAKSALDSVIDAMKADAKARAAEADARAAEARAKEAEWTAIATSNQVKREERILDMETHDKKEKEQKKEAKQLAQLARYQHDKASKFSGILHGAAEEEEQGGSHIPYDSRLKYKGSASGDNERVSLDQLRDLIFYHLRGNSEH
jgi:hypothetical protein